MSIRRERVSGLLGRAAAEFFQLEVGKQSLVTVTSCNISPDLRQGTIFISVLPESEEEAVLRFAIRKRTELRNFIRGKTRLKVVPFLDVELDKGEQNRRRIDTLLDEA